MWRNYFQSPSLPPSRPQTKFWIRHFSFTHLGNVEESFSILPPPPPPRLPSSPAHTKFWIRHFPFQHLGNVEQSFMSKKTIRLITVKPRFTEVPRDQEMCSLLGGFVISVSFPFTLLFLDPGLKNVVRYAGCSLYRGS